MDTHEILVGRMRGGLSPEDYQAWAESLVLSGTENEDLQFFAFSQNLHWEEIERRLPKILSYLGEVVPKSEMDLLIEAERRLIEQYTTGQLTGEELVRSAVHFYHDSEYDKRFSVWFGLDDDLDIIKCGENTCWYQWDTNDIEGSIRKILIQEIII